VYLGDGSGNWTLRRRSRAAPGRTMPVGPWLSGDLNQRRSRGPGRGVPALGSLHLLRRWRGGFTGAPWTFPPQTGISIPRLADVNKDGHPNIPSSTEPLRPGLSNGPMSPRDGPWRVEGPRSDGLKPKFPAAGIAVEDLDGDGNLRYRGRGISPARFRPVRPLWFRGDGKGGWRLDSGERAADPRATDSEGR